MDVTVNETPLNVPRDLGTWGEVLDWLESAHLKPGQCITRVFLGAEEAINYRHRSTCEMALSSLGEIRIESGDFDTVVCESLTELDTELRRSIGLTEEIVRLLESRQSQEAYAQLAQLLDTVRVFLTVFSEDLGWDEQGAAVSRAEVSASLEGALTQLIAAQEGGFWVSICDVLAYEITPILESWQKLVERTRVRIN